MVIGVFSFGKSLHYILALYQTVYYCILVLCYGYDLRYILNLPMCIVVSWVLWNKDKYAFILKANLRLSLYISGHFTVVLPLAQASYRALSEHT